MCVIVLRPRVNALAGETLRECWFNNPHGWGIMYPAGDGRVAVQQGLKLGEFAETYNAIPEDREIAVHFRWATHGKKDEGNLHPFKVLDLAEHGQDLWLMHNGIIQGINTSRDPGRSDTYHWVKYQLTPILSRCPELLHAPEFQEILTDIGGWSKCLFMDGQGRIVTTNTRDWKQQQGCAFSNLNSIGVQEGDPHRVNRKVTADNRVAPVSSGRSGRHTTPLSTYGSGWDWDDGYDWRSYNRSPGGSKVTGGHQNRPATQPKAASGSPQKAKTTALAVVGSPVVDRRSRDQADARLEREMDLIEAFGAPQEGVVADAGFPGSSNRQPADPESEPLPYPGHRASDRAILDWLEDEEPAGGDLTIKVDDLPYLGVNRMLMFVQAKPETAAKLLDDIAWARITHDYAF